MEYFTNKAKTKIISSNDKETSDSLRSNPDIVSISPEEFQNIKNIVDSMIASDTVETKRN